jgi:peptidoglycan/xylan/chitin deacetylase (PgdA/CDA1 family)
VSRPRQRWLIGPALVAAVGGALTVGVVGSRDGARLHGRLVAPAAAAVLIPPPPLSRRARDPQAAALARFARLGLPVYCGGGTKREVALTFDDGPGPYTLRMIRILRRDHARATFFLVGKELARYPGVPRAEATVAALGDHTWTHPDLALLPAVKVDAELASTERAIRALVRTQVRLFRPPYGLTDPAVAREVHALGLVEVLWSIDSTDSAPGASIARTVATVERLVRPGSIVLMHENRGTTLAAVHYWLLRFLAARHLHPVSVPALLADDPPSPAQLRAGRAGCLAR